MKRYGFVHEAGSGREPLLLLGGSLLPNNATICIGSTRLIHRLSPRLNGHALRCELGLRSQRDASSTLMRLQALALPV